MTTGLQRVPATASRRTNPLATILRLAATPFRMPPRPVRRHAASALSAVRPAHDIHRGSRPTRATRARDVHDAAVMRGVFPPRI